MSYDIGSYIDLTYLNPKKTATPKLFQPSTEYFVGARVRFLDWLSGAASLDLSTA